MPNSDDHTAAMFFIAGVRGALSKLGYDGGVFGGTADAMERNVGHLDDGDAAAVRIAARWLRSLDTQSPS